MEDVGGEYLMSTLIIPGTTVLFVTGNSFQSILHMCLVINGNKAALFGEVGIDMETWSHGHGDFKRKT